MPTEILNLNAITSPAQWTVNGTYPNGSGYLQSTGAGPHNERISIYAPTDYYAYPSDTENPITQIDVSFRLLRGGAGTPKQVYVSMVTSGGATAEAGPFYPPSAGSAVTYGATFTTRPGGGAWTAADLEELEINFRADSGTQSQNLDNVSLLLTYTVEITVNEPDNLTISDIDSDFVTLTWDDNSAVETHFELQRSLDGSTWTTLVTLDPDVETYTDTTVASVTEYFYRVRAYNAEATSDWSDTVSDTTPAYSGPAIEPTNFGATNVNPTSFELSWTNGGFSDSYEVEQSSDGGSTWLPFATSLKDFPFVSVSGKLPGSSYMYRVRGVNTVGNSDWVESLEITLPERSFREFLQKEVLQDVVKYFGWYDRGKLPNQAFTVTQEFYGATNLTAEEINIPYKYEWVDISHPAWGLVYYFKQTNILKITPPLIAELPTGTLLFGIGPKPAGSEAFFMDTPNDNLIKSESWEDYLDFVGTGTATAVTIAQNPNNVDDEGNILIDGAAIGDDILYLNYQYIDIATGDPVGAIRPFTMSGTYNDFRSVNTGYWGTVFANFTITTTIDYSANQFDAASIYESITNEALLKLGYSEESEVPESLYQKFRDAGRVAAWRFVAYSSVHLNAITENTTITGVGAVDLTKQLQQIFEMALKELDISEQVYRSRYETAPVVVNSVSKPRPTSYSSGVTVRF